MPFCRAYERVYGHPAHEGVSEPSIAFTLRNSNTVIEITDHLFTERGVRSKVPVLLSKLPWNQKTGCAAGSCCGVKR